MPKLTKSIILLAILLFSICGQAEEQFILSVEEIRSLSHSEWVNIGEEMQKVKYAGRVNYKKNFERLEDEFLQSIGVIIDLRNAKLRAANETVELYTEIGKRKRFDPVGITQEWMLDEDIPIDDIDSVWHMQPVEIDADKNLKRGSFNRKYLIIKSGTIIDSIFVWFAPMVGALGFVPRKTFVINSKPVINYVGIIQDPGRTLMNPRNEKLWIDGVHINDLYQLDRAIMPCYYDDKLFFVFQKDDKWGWSYDGEMHYNVWDKVSHDFGQGESIPDIRRPNALTGFTAERGDNYYTCTVVI